VLRKSQRRLRTHCCCPVHDTVVKTVHGQVQAFQLVRETKGAEATPSGWQPGRLTLKVGPDLVGNVWKVWSTDLAF
jgi:alkyl hydroperoxide reductase subunit AhpC